MGNSQCCKKSKPIHSADAKYSKLSSLSRDNPSDGMLQYSILAEQARRAWWYSMLLYFGCALLPIIVHLPPLFGQHWPDCAHAPGGWLEEDLCMVAYHMIAIVAWLANLVVALWGHLWFTAKTAKTYSYLVLSLIATDFTMFVFETKLVIERLDGTFDDYPWWGIAEIFLAAVIFLVAILFGLYVLSWRSVKTPYVNDGFFHPATEAELCSLVKWATANGFTVRVAGARHSVHPAYWLDDWKRVVRVFLDNYNAIESLTQRDDGTWVVTAQAGANLGVDPENPKSNLQNSIVFHLQQAGLALSNLGGITHQTVSGFMQTGSDGGSTKHGLPIVGLRVIDAEGNVHSFDDQNSPEDLYAAQVSMGLSGVVSAVSLGTVPTFRIANTTYTMTRTDLEKSKMSGDTPWQTFFESQDYCRVLWTPQPGIDRCQVWSGEQLTSSEDVEPFHPAETWVPHNPSLAEQTLLRIMYALVPKMPYNCCCAAFLKFAIKAAFPIAAPKTTSGWWFEVLPMDTTVSDTLFPVEFTELWVPLDKTDQVMAILIDYYAGDNKHLERSGPLCVELYAAPESPALLAMSNGHPCARFDFFWPAYAGGNPQDFFNQFYHLFTDNDIPYRAHWGKFQPPVDEFPQRTPEALYPDTWARWNAHRLKMDPTGKRFMSPYWEKLLHLDSSGTLEVEMSESKTD